MRIDIWVDREDISDAEFARRCGWEEPNGRVRAHRIIRKGQMPSPEDMKDIFTATSGDVSANDFYGLRIPKLQRHTEAHP